MTTQPSQTPETLSVWKTPGPYLGIIMGLGSPFLIFVYERSGWVFALAGLVALALVAGFVVSRFKGEDGARAYGSPALMRYNTRFMLASAAYVGGLFIAIAIHNSAQNTNAPVGPLAFAVPLLPTLPALAMIVIMARYLVEESDEYLRHRASLSAIIGLGFVLVIGTVWGFLETFGLVPHIWAWWVVPVWAIGLGIGQGLLALSERGEDREEEPA